MDKEDAKHMGWRMSKAGGGGVWARQPGRGSTDDGRVDCFRRTPRPMSNSGLPCTPPCLAPPLSFSLHTCMSTYPELFRNGWHGAQWSPCIMAVFLYQTASRGAETAGRCGGSAIGFNPTRPAAATQLPALSQSRFPCTAATVRSITAMKAQYRSHYKQTALLTNSV